MHCWYVVTSTKRWSVSRPSQALAVTASVWRVDVLKVMIFDVRTMIFDSQLLSHFHVVIAVMLLTIGYE